MDETLVICNLSRYMEDKELNITQLASELSVTTNTVRSYAKNRFSRIDCAIASKLCKHFGVSLGEMFELASVKEEVG